MGNILWQQLLFFFMFVCHEVESRHCKFITADNTAYTFFCSAYEYCCGNACCRPPVFKFYQFWYFWLSVILILLLCSGGSWWYRFRYQTQFISTPHFIPASGPNNQDFRPNAGVLYYPSTERVYLSNINKDPNTLPTYLGGVTSPPPYSSLNTGSGLSYQGCQQPTGQQQVMPPPPGFRYPPPSYDSIVQHSTPLPNLQEESPSTPQNSGHPSHTYPAANSTIPYRLNTPGAPSQNP